MRYNPFCRAVMRLNQGDGKIYLRARAHEAYACTMR